MWSSGKESTLQCRGPWVQSLVRELRSHMQGSNSARTLQLENVSTTMKDLTCRAIIPCATTKTRRRQTNIFKKQKKKKPLIARAGWVEKTASAEALRCEGP